MIYQSDEYTNPMPNDNNIVINDSSFIDLVYYLNKRLKSINCFESANTMKLEYTKVPDNVDSCSCMCIIGTASVIFGHDSLYIVHNNTCMYAGSANDCPSEISAAVFRLRMLKIKSDLCIDVVFCLF